MKIQILLVEADPVWRTMLQRFLNNEPDLHVIHAVETKEVVVSICSNNKIDIVLMETNLTQSNLEWVQTYLEISLSRIQSKVIALTLVDNEKILIDAFTAGAIHCVSKSDFRKIPDIVREVFNSTSPHEILIKEYIRMKEAEHNNSH